MALHELPSIVPDSLTQDERLAVVQEMAERADDIFQHEYFQLDEWFRQYDALYLLSYCSVNFLARPEGIDPEVKGFQAFYPYYLEILQAFSLMQPRSFVPKALGSSATELLNVMGRIGVSMQFRGMRDLSLFSDAELTEHLLLQKMRTHTAAVRNWGYAVHMHKVTHALAEEIKIEFMDFYGVDPAKLVDTLLSLAERIQDRVNEHIRKVRGFWRQRSHEDVVKAFVNSYPDVDAPDADDLFNMAGRHLGSLKAMLVNYSELGLADSMTFTVDDIVDAYGENADAERLRAIFERLTMHFEELRDQNREYVILDNPVWKKPFIGVANEAYFSAVIGLMPHYTLGILEGLITEVPGLDEKYRTRKGRFLESEIEDLFRSALPSGKIYRGSQWYDETGTNGENDLTAIVDCFAIVVEAKSGPISPPASRGAPDRFRRTVQELIEEPAEQANRFIALLKSSETPVNFPTREGLVNTIDARGVRYYIPLTITLEQLWDVSNLRELIESGVSTKQLSELAPVISLTDMMVIFEILNLQSERVHYLFRRREIDAHLRWNGDELDFLAFYLEHGFNIGETEFSGEYYIDLSMGSIQLDMYYEGLRSGVSVAKPALALTSRWQSILRRLDIGKVEHWLDSAVLLLNVPFPDQDKLERRFQKLCRQVMRGKVKKRHNCVIVVAGPPQRKFFAALYPYYRIDREIRNSFIAQVLDSQEARECRGALCMGVDLEGETLPYSVLALARTPDLFEEPSTTEERFCSH